MSYKVRYKFLRLNSSGEIVSNSGHQVWKLNEWVKTDNVISICRIGFHCSKDINQAFSYVQGEVLAKVQVQGRSESQTDKECWSEMRIIKAWRWDKRDSVALSIHAAELVIDNYEKLYPADTRVRDAIEAAKRVLKDDTEVNRSAARSAESAAWSARSAAWSAARSARSAARAARSAARSAWSARSAAAESAAWSAESAARSAESAAESAAWSAESAARSAESAAESAKKRLISDIEKWLKNHLEEMEEIKQF